MVLKRKQNSPLCERLHVNVLVPKRPRFSTAVDAACISVHRKLQPFAVQVVREGLHASWPQCQIFLCAALIVQHKHCILKIQRGIRKSEGASFDMLVCCSAMDLLLHAHWTILQKQNNFRWHRSSFIGIGIGIGIGIVRHRKLALTVVDVNTIY